MRSKKLIFLRGAVCAAAVFCIAFGLKSGEVPVVLNKAINICFECIGLGGLI